MPTSAQTEATAVQLLTIEIWPDYDQPAVLILLTGTLPEDTPLPASVTLPLPPSAQLNAVARISRDNVMSDDITYEQSGSSVTFTTPDLRFRVEYYEPYRRGEGNGRSYTFRWQSPLRVEQTAVTIQQPAAAQNMVVEPTAVNTTTHSDTLTYHNLPTAPIPPNAPYTVHLSYTLTSPQLTIETTTPPAAEAPPTRSATTYFLLAGASAIFIILYTGYHYGRRLKNQPKRKPHPIRQKFCHNCGSPTQPSDKFCRQCATPLKK